MIDTVYNVDNNTEKGIVSRFPFSSVDDRKKILSDDDVFIDKEKEEKKKRIDRCGRLSLIRCSIPTYC